MAAVLISIAKTLILVANKLCNVLCRNHLHSIEMNSTVLEMILITTETIFGSGTYAVKTFH